MTEGASGTVSSLNADAAELVLNIFPYSEDIQLVSADLVPVQGLQQDADCAVDLVKESDVYVKAILGSASQHFKLAPGDALFWQLLRKAERNAPPPAATLQFAECAVATPLACQPGKGAGALKDAKKKLEPTFVIPYITNKAKLQKFAVLTVLLLHVTWP